MKLILSKKNKIGLFICGIILFLVGQELSLLRYKPFQFWGEKDFIIFQSKPFEIITWGGSHLPQAENLIDSLQSLFLAPTTLSLENLKTDKSYHFSDIQIQKFTDQIYRLITPKGAIIWGFAKGADFEYLKSVSVSFKADFWILPSSNFPSFFPPPKTAIFLLSNRKPAQKLKTFALKNQTPLVTIEKTNGFWVQKTKVGWKLKGR